MPKTPALDFVPLDELLAASWERNPKLHDLDAIGASIWRFGFTAPVLFDTKTKRLVAGHGRVQSLVAGREDGRDPPKGIVLQDGVWRVPTVRLAFRSKGEAEAYVLADNQLTIAGGWDDAAVGEILRDLHASEVDVLSLGFSRDVLEKHGIAEDVPIDAGTRTPPDESIQPHGVAKPGDIWTLGSHRLVVGDSFGAATRRALLRDTKVPLVFTDPPYAIYGSSTGIGADIADDRMVRPFFRRLAQIIAEETRIWAHVYVCCDWRSWPAVYDSFRNRLAPKNLVVWDKGGSGLGSSYANTYELVGFFARLPPPKTMRSTEERGQRQVYAPNLVRVNRASGEARNHNASKPVDLVSIFLENSSDPGDVVLDLFGGGGSTLEAAERTGRHARIVEINPDNADKIIERWVKLTGGTPTRIEDGFDPSPDTESAG